MNKTAEAAQRFAEIRKAFEVLRDPSSRLQYDLSSSSTFSSSKSTSNARPSPSPSPSSPNTPPPVPKDYRKESISVYDRPASSYTSEIPITIRKAQKQQKASTASDSTYASSSQSTSNYHRDEPSNQSFEQFWNQLFTWVNTMRKGFQSYWAEREARRADSYASSSNYWSRNGDWTEKTSYNWKDKYSYKMKSKCNKWGDYGTLISSTSQI